MIRRRIPGAPADMKTRPTTLFGILVAMVCGVMIGITTSAAAEQTATVERLPLQDLRAFAEVLDRIRSAYVEEVDDRVLFENAIKGMLQGLDPHSAYLDGEDFEELQESTSGRYGGVGIEVGIEGGTLRVIAPIDDTPAARAGIRAGDVIIAVDDEPLGEPSVFDAVESMRGEPGSPVRLRIRREGEPEPLDFDLVRAPIAISSVDARFLEDGFAYVRASQFETGTGAGMGELTR